jgi:pimeloyl-ACP methyl ester carboxylesterase
LCGNFQLKPGSASLLAFVSSPNTFVSQAAYGTEAYVEDLTIRYIPNCSHWVQQEQPQQVNQFMREFLAKDGSEP